VKQLLAACREQDPQKRLAALDQILNIDSYITFTALESILAHWDGYNFNRNNYRFYHDVTTKKFVKCGAPHSEAVPTAGEPDAGFLNSISSPWILPSKDAAKFPPAGSSE